MEEKIINDILIEMSIHLDRQTLSILKNILISKFHNIEITKKNCEIATNDSLNDYILDLFMIKKAPKLSEKTVEQYIRHISALISLLNKPLTHMTENDIEYFLICYKKRGNENRTVNNARRYLSAFFTWMRKSKLISENPVENIDAYKETSKMIEHLEPEQWEQLKTGCHDNRDRALIEFMRCTAMRNGEVPKIRVCDVDWHDGKIIVYGHKTDRYRIVCIDRVAQDYLHRYLNERGVTLDSHASLFISQISHKALSTSGIYRIIKSIAKRANITINVYPHLLRKTTATNIIKRGGSTEEAGEYLGHAERNTAGKFYAYKGDDYIINLFKLRVASV